VLAAVKCPVGISKDQTVPHAQRYPGKGQQWFSRTLFHEIMITLPITGIDAEWYKTKGFAAPEYFWVEV
jgi:hypothetical protein